MVLDSGVIQGAVGEDAYIELLNEFGEDFQWCAHHDAMGDFYQSNGNYNYAREYLSDALPQRLLYVLHGSPPDFTEEQYRACMTVLMHATCYIGIGGLVRYCRRGQLEVIERYLDAIYERLGPEVCRWIHLFGIGNYRLLRRYRNVFGSADSSLWLCGVRGELLQPDGTRRRLLKPFDKLRALQQNVEMMLQWATDENACPDPLTPPFHQIIPIDDPFLLESFPSSQRR
jgi:hypothetical protein